MYFRAGTDCPAAVRKAASLLFYRSLISKLASALGAAGNGGNAAHPWVEHDPATGARALRMPLPAPEVVRGLADALHVIADSLRGRAPGA